jgi:sugar/nucleoside kinase (ribokinase family)
MVSSPFLTQVRHNTLPPPYSNSDGRVSSNRSHHAAPAQELPEDIYKYCDIVSPNETELALLTGRSVDTIEDATAAARVLISRYKLVIFT